ncbi:winged helix-turn-helix domain-containing protein [Enterococcus sp. BWM-S5]|uniref:Winged helix-turn-helix domain-containing protein n=1 Tax=Enterococcus larvae TaxID=2794352 RepID=A0ABS4CLS2_9ENTE|nr:winged helix-turn-helix domain-containing protein [Enterococcus larvae]MBP1046990.1 winged helix-turn-helix domain-containing protein [Enterococcus larvae]
MNAGIINLSEKFDEHYSKELEKNDISVIPLTADDFEQEIKNLDAVIIRENALEDAALTCKILLKLKEKSDLYVWVFSSGHQKFGRTVYLQLGALGIIPEDCDATELQLIVTNSLKKMNRKRENAVLSANDYDFENDMEYALKFKLIPRNHSLKISGKKEIPLTNLEYKALDMLFRNANNTVTYEELFESVWDKDFSCQGYRIANLIFHLREKLKKNSEDPTFIRTVRSRGYMLDLSSL